MSASMSSTSSLTNNLAAMAGARSNSATPRMWTVYIQCYFVTIATILGTGILGLPVTLAHSGLYPFLLTFIIGFIIQSLLIIYFTDILQRAHAVQYRTLKIIDTCSIGLLMALSRI